MLFRLYGVTPDVATYGKTISGGHPVAAVCGRADILDCGDPRRKARGEEYAFVSGTVNGNPIGEIGRASRRDRV